MDLLYDKCNIIQTAKPHLNTEQTLVNSVFWYLFPFTLRMALCHVLLRYIEMSCMQLLYRDGCISMIQFWHCVITQPYLCILVHTLICSD